MLKEVATRCGRWPRTIRRTRRRSRAEAGITPLIALLSGDASVHRDAAGVLWSACRRNQQPRGHRKGGWHRAARCSLYGDRQGGAGHRRGRAVRLKPRAEPRCDRNRGRHPFAASRSLAAAAPEAAAQAAPALRRSRRARPRTKNRSRMSSPRCSPVRNGRPS